MVGRREGRGWREELLSADGTALRWRTAGGHTPLLLLPTAAATMNGAWQYRGGTWGAAVGKPTGRYGSGAAECVRLLVLRACLGARRVLCGYNFSGAHATVATALPTLHAPLFRDASSALSPRLLIGLSTRLSVAGGRQRGHRCQPHVARYRALARVRSGLCFSGASAGGGTTDWMERSVRWTIS